jgi:hypothetical protein
MPEPTELPRRFRVHARHVECHYARIVEEPSFEAAAVAYCEDLALVSDDGSRISVIVRDLHDGREHCFSIDLETGGTTPCG